MTVYLKDVKDERVLHTLEHDDRINCAAFSSDDSKLAMGTRRKVCIWDTETEQLARTLPALRGVDFVAFSPDASKITYGSGYSAQTWDLQRNERLPREIHHLDDINALAYSPDSCTFISGSRDATLKIWNAETVTPLETREVSSIVLSLAFSPASTGPGARLLASGLGFPNLCVKIWDTVTWTIVKTLPGY
ncbi:WD40-repeat-containing domain protein [Aspergillus multicolor]|uniref:WD40 repeat domain-containing protein n=1 Tax=Aspergillus multicolor TaxID=41759 RepID=UPI003CCE170D